MNKILLVFTISVLLLSCKTKSAIETTTSKTAGKVQSELKGNWTITDVTYPGSGYFKVNSFQVAESKCFIGSSWKFVPNNNKGTMSLNRADCTAFNSSIVWSINKEGVFTLKFIDSGVKSKSVNQGFMMKIANQTPTSFQLIDQINVGGQAKEVIYHFGKIN